MVAPEKTGIVGGAAACAAGLSCSDGPAIGGRRDDDDIGWLAPNSPAASHFQPAKFDETRLTLG